MSSVGAKLVEQLAHLGVREFFGVAGTEFSPVIERLAAGDLPLRCHTLPHEAVAVHMAAGSALRSGKVNALMLHASIGTLNAAAAIMSAHRLRAPLILIAGRTPTDPGTSLGARDLFVHSGQEVFDQAAPVREFVKWHYELRRADDLPAVLARAHQLAASGPQGPVYLSIPRELLLASCEAPLVEALPRPEGPQISNVKLAEIQTLLQQAQRPLLVASELGHDRESFELLAEVAERYPLRVLTPSAQTLNLPHRHPAFVPQSQVKLLAEADLVMNLDCEVPWVASKVSPSPTAKLITVGLDPLLHAAPYPVPRQGMLVQTSVASFLRQLLAATAGAARPQHRWGSTSAPLSTRPGAFGLAEVSQVLAENWNDELILYNELALNADEVPLSKWGSYYRTGSASCLGQILGQALGVGLHDPRRPLCVVGDGSYYFSNPLVIHWKAQQQGLFPIVIILNNQGMSSILQNTAHLRTRELGDEVPFVSLRPGLDFAQIARSFAGIGHSVSTRDELARALQGALAQRDRQVLIDARIS